MGGSNVASLQIRLRALVIHPDRRVVALTIVALSLGSAFLIALYTALLGPFFALAGGLGLAVGIPMLCSHRWSLTALLGISIILPFATLPFKVGITPTFLDLALIAIYLVWVMQIATGKRRSLRGSPMGIFVGAFAILAFFAFVAGLSHTQPSSTTIRRFAELLLGITLFFVVVDTMRKDADIRWLVRVLMLAGLGASAIAIVLYVIPEHTSLSLLNSLGRLGYPTGDVLRYIEDSSVNPMRAIGTSVDPNVLGGLLILVTAITAPQLLAARPLLPRWLTIIVLGSNFLALYLTYSRGSMVGLAAAIFLIGILRYRRLLLILIVVAILVTLLPIGQSYITHFLEGIQGVDRATQMRFGEYKDALILIGRYPWFGVGFAGSPDIDTYIGVSNVYLLIAEEMGSVGLTLFLLAITTFFLLLAGAWRRVRQNPEHESLMLGIVAAVAGLLVGGMFDHYLFNLTYPHMTSLFWITLGLGIAVVRQSSETSTAPVSERCRTGGTADGTQPLDLLGT